MKNYTNGCTRFKSWMLTMGVAVMLATSAQAAQFQFGVLIQAGAAGPSDWEIGVGDSSGGLAVVAELGPHWTNGVDRAIQLEYLQSTNTVTARVYNGATPTGVFSQATYQPAGGAAVAANIWTLPAASFFVTAQGTFAGGPVLASSVTISNLTLSGVSGAINVIQPIQQTTLDASRGILGGTSTVSQTQDIVFQADSTGSWRLQGTIQMTGLGGFLQASGNDLSLQFNALASDVPEPSTFALMGIGLTLFGLSRWKTRSV